MNDPNGMFYLNGNYHLFYQHYPDDNVWGPMHWAHAISKDLIHWENKPIAIFPDGNNYIFSGSAIVDNENKSGLGNGENPPILAFYTNHPDLFPIAYKRYLENQLRNTFDLKGVPIRISFRHK